MAYTYTSLEGSGNAKRRALLGLWSIPGIGPVKLREVGAKLAAQKASFESLLPEPVDAWLPFFHLRPDIVKRAQERGTLENIAAGVLDRCQQLGIGICFADERAYPESLGGKDQSPPLLFYRGQGAFNGRGAAMVGTRHPDPGFGLRAQDLACRVALGGAVVVSGAAIGIDQHCHQGALDAKGVTWAFLGSGLGEIDPAQASLCDKIVDKGGTVFTEYPPSMRAAAETFPRRNRLIAWSSQAVVVLRAPKDSGTHYTVDYALEQGVPVLVVPGEFWIPEAGYNNWLLGKGLGRAITSAEEILEVVVPKVKSGDEVAASDQAAAPPVDLSAVSSEARQAYEAMARRPQPFDDVLAQAAALGPMDSRALLNALSELELFGLVVQHPGKLYERI